MRIVQIASPFGTDAGGHRTALDGLARGYVAAGHERVLVVPSASSSDRSHPSTGRSIAVTGRRLGSSGQHVVSSRPGLIAVLERVRPHRIEVTGDGSLAFLGPWARRAGIPSVLLVHQHAPSRWSRTAGPLAALGDAWERRALERFDRIVCTSWHVRQEIDRIGASSVTTVPLGVDLTRFSPAAGRPSGSTTEVVCVGRLARDRRPEVVIEAVRHLVGLGIDIRLTMVGGGPLRPALERRARALPVTFTGHVVRRDELAALVASAHVAITAAPLPAFSFGVLEAMACGTPVVVPAGGAGSELVLPDAGVAVGPAVGEVALGILQARSICRQATRRRAERFSWSSAVDAMLRAHGLAPAAGLQRMDPALASASRSSSGT